MILTLTPNPSVDLLFRAEELVWDEANRVEPPRRRAGGQGVNVARAVRALGGSARAVVALGGAAGRELRELLAAESLPLDVVEIAGDTRIFVAVRTSAGASLLLNPAGPRLSGAEVEALRSGVLAAIASERPAWVAACGSLPPGLPGGFYAEVGAAARAARARFVPDCDGEPLLLAAASGCDLLVPNGHEAGRLLGGTVEDAAAAADAARELRRRFGCPCVAVTLGAAGAVLATEEGCWAAAPPALAGGSAVGAGDAFLAALLTEEEREAPPPERLRAAVAAGTSVLHGQGGALVAADRLLELIREVTVTRL